jgi:hypothetical protein
MNYDDYIKYCTENNRIPNNKDYYRMRDLVKRRCVLDIKNKRKYIRGLIFDPVLGITHQNL